MMHLITFCAEQFPEVLNRSITASIVILFIIIARLFMRKMPSIFRYILWGIVLIRLFAPISIESQLSLVPETRPVTQAQLNYAFPVVEYQTFQDRQDNRFFEERYEYSDNAERALVEVSHSADPSVWIAIIWLFGMLSMAGYSLISYLRLIRKLRVAIPAGKGVYIADDISYPFVIGILCPRIYLPCTITEKEQGYILLHERHHICRGDHIIKAISFFALTIHWFNPLVWTAFLLSARDMEMSCDEAVMKKLGESVRQDYAASLLSLATGRRIIAGMPLAFGEGDTKERIRNLARWKKPTVLVMLLSLVVCLLLSVCLITDSKKSNSSSENVHSDNATSPISASDTASVDTSETTEADETIQNLNHVYLTAHQATSTDVVICFHCEDPEAELYRMAGYSLEQLNGDIWEPIDLGLEWYETADPIDFQMSSKPENGMFIPWETVGALPDGTYRIGQTICTERKPSEGQRMNVYAEFSLPSDTAVGPIPLDKLPQIYSGEQAMLDGCLVLRDGDAAHNQDAFKAFAEQSHMGVPGFIRIVDWHYHENSFYIAKDLEFDGKTYTLRWFENQQEIIRNFKYLKSFKGVAETEDQTYDAYERYVLTDDMHAEWNGLFPSYEKYGADGGSEYHVVYTDLIVYPDYAPIADTQQISIYAGKQKVAVIQDEQTVKRIESLLASAIDIGFAPKTYFPGPSFTLRSSDGNEITLIHDLEDDMFILNDKYYSYGDADTDALAELFLAMNTVYWPEGVVESKEFSWYFENNGINNYPELDGIWVTEDGLHQLEFDAHGRGLKSFDVTNTDSKYYFYYSLNEGTLYMNILGETQEYSYDLLGNTLTLQRNDVTTIYKKLDG